MRVGSLFSGYGGLDLAVSAAFGASTAWFVEFEKAPSRILAHHWPDVPNLGDVTAVDWSQVEPVDVLTGGFPCQDVSAAGRRAGLTAGTRSGLWSHMAEAINQLRPRWVVIENVRGLLSATAHRPMESEPDALGDRDTQPVLRALGAVLGDLADLGYDAQWCTVAAADVGAPHRRERVFVLAHPADAARDGRDERRPESAWLVGRPDAAVGGAAPQFAADARGGRLGGHEELDSEPAPGIDGERGGHADRRDVETRGPRVDLLPTPMAHPSGNSPEEHLRKKPGRTTVTDLAILVENDLMRNDGALLPTPTVQNSHGNTENGRGELLLPGAVQSLLPTPTASERGDCPSERERNTPDLIAVSHYFPTPLARDSRGRSADSREGAPGLPDTVSLLPTPGAADATGGGPDPEGRAASGHHVQIIDAALGMSSSWGKYAAAIARAEQAIGRPAPPPTELNRNQKPRLNAAFAEWMMMLPAGHVTDPAIGLSRSDQLKAIGNGVCPPQAYAAIVQLIDIAREY
ncbi:DNA methylase [Gordonia phage Phinally]|uniref:DNA methyltransferase n=1 Tax=Gordonia phage Phinally TaxID=1821560 RepID=UPI00078BA46B|nr:DNA methyltransferase [Gordonia phage Phinally]AMS02997.1 DNA methylase [Gordonia phage Phinally]